MIYVLGTGRCGTKTAARLLNGLHEPNPHLIIEATDFYHGRDSTYKILLQKLARRSHLGTPCISDYKQSTVVPLIAEIDATAEFLVLVREPIAAVASFNSRRWYRKSGNIWDENRLRPLTGFPPGWTAIMKCGWLWMETYRTIFASTGSGSFEIMETTQLGDQIHNASRKRPVLKLNDTEREFFSRSILPFWTAIRKRVAASDCGPIQRKLQAAQAKKSGSSRP